MEISNNKYIFIIYYWGIIALLAILFKQKKKGDYIAFGPAIGISTIILIFLET